MPRSLDLLPQRNIILADALHIDLNDIDGSDELKYDQLAAMYAATQMRCEQIIDELVYAGVEFSECPWLESYTPDDADYFATLLVQENARYGNVNVF